jgi:hypothetical protein
MSADDNVVHVDMVESFRFLTPGDEPNFVILRIATQDGKTYNFGLDRVDFTHVQRVWAFDLGALDRAIESGSPYPGKPVGAPDRKAS